jgi:serine/threonine protein kinase
MSRYSSATRLKSETDRLKSIHLEVAILHDLSHYNIIRVHELIELEMRIVVVMLYASPCTLLQYIQEQRKGAGVWCFPEMMAWSIFRQLISGVEYLHENLTIHRNLTLETILFDCKQNRAVITGFSIAEIAGKGSGQGLLGKYSTRLKYFCRPKFINPYFTAPEVLERYDSPFEICGTVDIEGKADVYSCGVILVSQIQKTSALQIANNLRVHNDKWRYTVRRKYAHDTVWSIPYCRALKELGNYGNDQSVANSQGR